MVEVTFEEHREVRYLPRAVAPPLLSANIGVQKWGERWVVLFRPDLHAELMRLALENDGATAAPEIVLGARIVQVVRSGVSPAMSYLLRAN